MIALSFHHKPAGSPHPLTLATAESQTISPLHPTHANAHVQTCRTMNRDIGHSHGTNDDTSNDEDDDGLLVDTDFQISIPTRPPSCLLRRRRLSGISVRQNTLHAASASDIVLVFYCTSDPSDTVTADVATTTLTVSSSRREVNCRCFSECA
mmetsp:Transcript_9405/g.25548  ORF Transcript_9405/g.25548 Transcript_9405/m.25548 type:complete len:152 (+) Transcript_9405:184-639(+)